MYPDESYSKYLFQNQSTFFNFGNNEQNSGGQSARLNLDTSLFCPVSFIGQCENK